jgi:hypothetical protein
MAKRVKGRVQITTDALKTYVNVIEDAFGGQADYAQLHKIYGAPDENETRYSPASKILLSYRRGQGFDSVAEAAQFPDQRIKSEDKGLWSVAVLPLENLSRDPEQEYFADGLTEALITSLAQISALRVVSRTTAMHYI